MRRLWLRNKKGNSQIQDAAYSRHMGSNNGGQTWMVKAILQGALGAAQLRDEDFFLDRAIQSGWVTTLSGA